MAGIGVTLSDHFPTKGWRKMLGSRYSNPMEGVVMNNPSSGSGHKGLFSREITQTKIKQTRWSMDLLVVGLIVMEFAGVRTSSPPRHQTLPYKTNI
jgi:hypothetical protein